MTDYHSISIIGRDERWEYSADASLSRGVFSGSVGAFRFPDGPTGKIEHGDAKAAIKGIMALRVEQLAPDWTIGMRDKFMALFSPYIGERGYGVLARQEYPSQETRDFVRTLVPVADYSDRHLRGEACKEDCYARLGRHRGKW